MDEASRRLGSCRWVWPLDVEDGGTNPADSNKSARSSLGRDLDQLTAQEVAPLELHQGAARYYDEALS